MEERKIYWNRNIIDFYLWGERQSGKIRLMTTIITKSGKFLN